MHQIRAIFNKQLKVILYALREAFISIIPFLIVSSISTLILQAISITHLNLDIGNITIGLSILQNALPAVVLVAISHQLAKITQVDSAASIVLSLSLLVSLQPLNAISFFGTSSSVFSLVIPIVSTLFFANLVNSKWLKTPQYASLDDSLRMIYRYTPAFIITFIFSLLFFFLAQSGFEKLLNSFIPVLSELSPSLGWQLFIRTIATHLLTFIGIHGTNIFDLLVDPTYLHTPILENFSAKNLIDTFVIFGGVGSCLALAISILINAKDQHAMKISKIAFPFLIFNISEIIFYGLPVVLNRKLVLPFLLIPVLNLGISILFLQYGSLSFTAILLPWTTPIFINAYLATGGNWLAVLFQLLLLTMNVLIYMFFIRRYVLTQSSTERLNVLSNKLNISSSMQSKRGIKFQEAQAFLVNSHVDTDDIIKLIIDNELTMYYQPIIHLKEQSYHHFEALLRLQKADGTILSPYFLPTLESAGLSSVIDIWVCRKVRADILAWQAEGFNPLVSVNIHPNTFLDDAVMQEIIPLLSGFNVQFELIERAFFNHDESSHMFELLKKMQFKLAVDDFGTGYSTLQSLHTTSADTIKFDKQLLDVTSTEKGNKIYHYASQMCNDLGFNIIAEGVETEAQLNIVMQAGVSNVQGWYFSEALPPIQAKQFAETFVLKKMKI